MPDSPVTLLLELANASHGPQADLDERPLLPGPHDHLVDAAAAGVYLAHRGLPIPPTALTPDELDRLRELRDIARAVASEPPQQVERRLARLLPRYTYRYGHDGRLAPTGSGWQALAAGALPGLFELLTHRDRVRTCGNPDCDWLFFDESRNGSRVWCEMVTCGSRAKMARYRLKRRKGAGTGTGGERPTAPQAANR